MSQVHPEQVDELVEAILRDTRLGSSANIDKLAQRVAKVGHRKSLVASLGSQNAPLLGTGVAS
jgi:hypothetical protein